MTYHKPMDNNLCLVRRIVGQRFYARFISLDETLSTIQVPCVQEKSCVYFLR